MSNIPPGFWLDARGNMIREDLIKPIEKTRDELVKAIAERARSTSQQLRAFKGNAFADIAAFVELSAEQYGAKVGGKKGNVTLYSFDGRFKVLRAITESIRFDERLQAAKSLIDECLQEWTAGARPEIQTLVNSAFQVDKEGNINTNRVLGLKRLQIEDERWQRAMQAIADAVQVIGSKSYIRVYERVGESDQYAPIALDMAGV